MEPISKPKHSFRAWFCFFLGINILLSLLFAVPFALINTDIRDNLGSLGDLALSSNIRESDAFKILLADQFQALTRLSRLERSVYDTPAIYSSAYVQLEDEMTNIACYVQNKNRTMIYNTIPEPEKNYTYNCLLLMQDNTLKLYKSNGTNILKEYSSGDIKSAEVSLEHGYDRLTRDFEAFLHENPANGDAVVMMALRSDFEPFENSQYYNLEKLRRYVRIAALAVLGVLLFDIFLLVFSHVKRNEKRRFIEIIAGAAAHVWLEFKIASIILVGAFMQAILEALFSNPYRGYDAKIIWTLLLVAGLWFFYFVIKDLQINRTEFFRHNSIRAAAKAVRRLSVRLRFEKRMLASFWFFAVSEIVLILLFFATVFSSGFSLIFAAIGILIFILYARRYSRFVADTGKLVSHISLIKSGDLKTQLPFSEDSDLFDYAVNLNTIQSGMSAAVSEQLASERMKVDLITNVSHDLKTPLTSIIGYIDLIEKEELQPQVRDFVRILSQKAQRLKSMIQDIFDVSKATSGNLTVQAETIDLVRLVEQTAADMREKIDASGLMLRITKPNAPLYISSDGQKLYRVFQNLIDNALRYSLAGSRIYIHLNSDSGRAVAEVKNTAVYEPDFEPKEIAERFVRGDKARSGEGSGLGLSIAESFTTACGGAFTIDIDDDIFKVRLTFPQSAPPQKENVPEVIQPSEYKEQITGQEASEENTARLSAAGDGITADINAADNRDMPQTGSESADVDKCGDLQL